MFETLLLLADIVNSSLPCQKKSFAKKEPSSAHLGFLGDLNLEAYIMYNVW